ncbi:peptidase inhibitor family I36 protein [Streptomyces flaveolus]|uniref:peptidase inhibitor family I36 protein n=1 Tax=Streptomyces flaveolus TaxID=67297 RepID=UPI00341CDD90
MKLAIKSAVVAAAIASTTVLGAAGTASAGGAVGVVQLYDGSRLTGDMATVPPVNIPALSWDWNDRASSVWNLSNTPICIHTDANYNGYSYTIPPFQIQELWFLYDNAVSSISIGSCGG